MEFVLELVVVIIVASEEEQRLCYLICLSPGKYVCMSVLYELHACRYCMYVGMFCMYACT